MDIKTIIKDNIIAILSLFIAGIVAYNSFTVNIANMRVSLDYLGQDYNEFVQATESLISNNSKVINSYNTELVLLQYRIQKLESMLD